MNELIEQIDHLLFREEKCEGKHDRRNERDTRDDECVWQVQYYMQH